MDNDRVKELERRLIEINARIHAMFGKPGWTIEMALATYEEQEQTERHLAAAKGEAFANPLAIACIPSLSGSAEFFLQTEFSSAFVIFRAVARTSDSTVRYSDVGWAIVRFKNCAQSKFGYPNDEAFSGHALYGRGFSGCGVFEVVNSHWEENLRNQNRIAFPDSEPWPWNLRHLIFAFKENVLECLVKEFEVEISNRPFDQVLAEETGKVLRD